MPPNLTPIVERFVNDLSALLNAPKDQETLPPRSEFVSASEARKRAGAMDGIDFVPPPPGVASPFAGVSRDLRDFFNAGGAIKGREALAAIADAVDRDKAGLAVMITCDDSRHEFTIRRPGMIGQFHFQRGEAGKPGFVPGLHNEDLLRVILQRLQCAASAPCDEHLEAAEHLAKAIEALERRKARLTPVPSPSFEVGDFVRPKDGKLPGGKVEEVHTDPFDPRRMRAHVGGHCFSFDELEHVNPASPATGTVPST
jgi:hypothetical protein